MSHAEKPDQGSFNPHRLDAMRMARQGALLQGRRPLAHFSRLLEDLHAPVDAGAEVAWSANAELRTAPSGAPEAWLHLEATSLVPLTCQRCLEAVQTGLAVDRWFRFVADEAAALAEDDDCEEDLLALEPRPDLLAVIEDELIMELPLVPMHGRCPDTPAALAPAPETPAADERPHPFSALARLKGGQ
mgnify:CR=1 FL=1